MLSSILRKMRRKIIYYNLVRKYFYKKNISIKKQKKLNSVFDLDLSKNSIVDIECDLDVRENVSIRCRENANLYIGKNVFFNNNCILTCRKKIVISDNVMIGPNVVIFDHDHNFRAKNFRKEFICKDIFIGKNVWIGANSCILKGSNIGDNAVIAAGTVVNGDVPANCIYYGKGNIRKIGDKNE